MVKLFNFSDTILLHPHFCKTDITIDGGLFHLCIVYQLRIPLLYNVLKRLLFLLVRLYTFPYQRGKGSTD